METYQTLSIESFSYSWLANMNTSSESPGRSLGDSRDAYNEANSFIHGNGRAVIFLEETF